MLVRPLSPGLQERAAKELNEVPSRTQEDLQHIKNWLSKQPHLNARTDDQWLLSFLRSCKFSLERTKEKLDFHYTMRSLVPEYYTNRDPFLPEIQEFLTQGTILPLPKTVDSAGSRVLLHRAKNSNPDILTPTVGAKAMTMILDVLLLEDDNFVISGGHSIDDLEDVAYKYAVTITPTMLKKWVMLFQSAYPLRIRGVHFTNVPTFILPLLRLIKHFASDKIKNRIHFYMDDDIEEMYKSIPLSILPEEYGGQGGSIEEIKNQLKAKVESYRDWFVEDAQYVSDETKRPGKPITSADLFGVEGSFRKLEVD